LALVGAFASSPPVAYKGENKKKEEKYDNSEKRVSK
jgi:hypothetical protein